MWIKNEDIRTTNSKITYLTLIQDSVDFFFCFFLLLLLL